ncbi:lanC-like protein 2 isoform X2 [Chelonus insularis]|nr:lanC-like protein 2 isoform X2 [Chelonus insularis]XP_034938032.1 lanC-like protein 2 isoform X2 [Chelonus insularis]XP_034938033.1 lanC-like protein 2 isoform X2 [Chelonus insularis]
MSSKLVARDDGRHYSNPYLNLSPDNDKNIVDSGNNDIHADFNNLLKDNIHKLMDHLDKHKTGWLTRDDTSIYTGNSGIAYMYYLYGKQFNDESYITKALELIKIRSKSTSRRDITFLTGEAGRLSLGAVIYHITNNKAESLEMISKLQAMLDEAVMSTYDELLYGRVGYLYALLFVNKNISPTTIDREIIKKTINCILISGKKYAKERKKTTPLMYSWHDTEYLGGAHGLAGILYILLQAREYLTEEQLKNEIQPALEYLLSLRYPSGNFPSSVGSKTDKLVHWCHGAPSMTMLYILASEVFNNEKYLDVAKECGEVIWHRGLLIKGCGICHGVSGNAYSFLCLYQKTKDIMYLWRACKFAAWCFDYESNQCRSPDRPYSLFEGLAGIIYYLIDLTKPSFAKFPGYTL